MKIRKTSIANFAKKNFFITFLVFVLVAVGWFFLLMRENPKEETPEPVQWSQKEDYKIEKTSEGTFIKNESVGISFKVPEGWEIEMGENNNFSSQEYWITLLGPDSAFDKNNLLAKGCALSLWVNLQKEQLKHTKEEIKIINQNPEKYKINKNSTKETIEIDNHQAVKWIGRPEENEMYQKVGKAIEIKIPLRDKVIYVDTRILPDYEENCSQVVDNFLKDISIK